MLQLKGARIVSLSEQGTIESGNIIVRDGRISCVGDCEVSDAERVIDLSGKTIVPGFMDMHEHKNTENVSPLKQCNSLQHFNVRLNMAFICIM